MSILRFLLAITYMCVCARDSLVFPNVITVRRPIAARWGAIQLFM
jgi:hypothetical protein